MTARLKSRWAAGEPAVGAWCTIPSSVPAEFLAISGFDYVGVDCQHGLAGPDSLVPMLQAINGHDVPAVVRVPVGSGWWIQRALDSDPLWQQAGFTRLAIRETKTQAIINLLPIDVTANKNFIGIGGETIKTPAFAAA